MEEDDEQPIHILIVEDETFQRLSLVDILQLFKYTTDEAPNGKIAWEKLNNPNNNFDLVLLDIMMPIMDGVELLEIMKQREHTNSIDVIMMSVTDEDNKIQHCLKLGAMDYLIKPIRSNDAMFFGQRVKDAKRARMKEKINLNMNSLGNYEHLRLLGQGTSGKVSLVKHKQTGQLFAIKQMNIQQMNQKEAQNAENEVALLKVLVAPTIIRYYHSFFENGQLNIVMEYAEAGNLQDKLNMYEEQNKKVSNKQILQ